MEEPKNWGESQKILKDNASVEEFAASNMRESILINLSPEEQELLKNSNLKLEVSPARQLNNGDVERVATIVGIIEGKNVVLSNRYVRNGTTYGLRNLDENGNDVPGPIWNMLPEDRDIITAEVDGKTLSYQEAKDLWIKYHKVAEVTRTDERLVDYVNDSNTIEEDKAA